MEIVDFSKIEEKWQKKWEKDKVSEVEEDDKKKKFFITTPYPYISGSLHLGHGRAVVESDIYARYKRMKGFNVLFPMAFHISGTPVLGISSAIKNGDKSKIKLYSEYVSAYISDKENVKKIVKSFEDPQKLVDFFIPKMIGEYKQLGLAVDWRRSFTSGDFEHQQMVDWQFRKYYENGFLSKGKYPVLYSPEDESAMGEDDIKDADTDPVEKTEFTLLKFKFGDKFLVAATLRPETIFGQTNIWMNPKIKYVEAQVGKETWILSKEAVGKLKYQRENVKELGLSKEKFIGKEVIAPMIKRKLLILPSNFVDADVGTGIVTSVPSDSAYDYVALRELQNDKGLEKDYGFTLEQIKAIEEIEIIPIIKTDKYGDKSAVDLVEKKGIILQDDEKLPELTQEIYKEGFHTGVLLDICGKYSGIKVKDAKDKMKRDLIENGDAEIMFDTSRKAFSRGGGKILVAVLDGQWFLDFNSDGWKKKAYECLEGMEIAPENMKRQFEDTFAWLDKRPCARKRGLGTKFPFDKEWVIESLSDSTIYMTLYPISHLIKKYKLKRDNLNKDFFDYVYLANGNVKEVSEKTGVDVRQLQEFRDSFEYWMPMDLRHTFSLHLSNHLSFMIFAFSGIFPKEYWPKKISFHGLIVSEGEKMSKSKGNVITILNLLKNYGADTFRFYMTHSTNLMGTFDWREEEARNYKNNLAKVFTGISEISKKAKKGKVSDYYVHKFNKIKKIADSRIEEMKYREYNSSVFFDVLNLLNKAKLSLNDKELPAFYHYILEDWIKMLSPVVPHISQELWIRAGKKGFVARQNWIKFDEAKINDDFDKIDEALDKTVSDVLNVIKIINEKQGKEVEKVYLYVLPNELKNYNLDLLERRVGKEIKVFAVNDKKKYDPEKKAGKAKPGKPGIFIE